MRYIMITVAIITSLGFASPMSSDDECLRCHGNHEPEEIIEESLLAEQFSMRWRMYEYQKESRPPVANLASNTPYINGVTHYDWSRQAMTEIYEERCIDIFEEGRDYSCQFLSVEDKTYFIKNPSADEEICCLWSAGEFWAPRPDVLSHMIFDKSQELRGQPTEWRWLDIGLPGPFGYGMDSDSSTPAAFWFPVFGGWVQQEFYDFQPRTPPASAFDIPQSCRAQISVCGE